MGTLSTISLRRLHVDYRKGSGELIPLLESMAVPTFKDTLPSGDFSFTGNGPKGLCMVGVERKRIKDMLDCMQDSRFVGLQLPRMIEHYDFRYLIVEGIVRPQPETGVLEEHRAGQWREVCLGRQRFNWEALDKFLTTLEHAPIKIRRVGSPHGTAETVTSLYHWWTGKLWHEHKSLSGLYSAAYPTIPLTEKDDWVRAVAKELPGIGPEKSLWASRRWKSIEDMVLATAEEWAELPGVGPVIAAKVVSTIKGREGRKRKE